MNKNDIKNIVFITLFIFSIKQVIIEKQPMMDWESFASPTPSKVGGTKTACLPISDHYYLERSLLALKLLKKKVYVQMEIIVLYYSLISNIFLLIYFRYTFYFLWFFLRITILKFTNFSLMAHQKLLNFVWWENLLW